MSNYFHIIGEPCAQKRHRHVSRGKFVSTYDPSSKDKKEFLKKAIVYAPDTPPVDAISIDVTFIFSRPKSHYRTGKNSGVLKSSAPNKHTKKPDIDNLIKFLLDSLNGVFFKDDSQVVSIRANKEYVKSIKQEAKTIINIY